MTYKSLLVRCSQNLSQKEERVLMRSADVDKVRGRVDPVDSAGAVPCSPDTWARSTVPAAAAAPGVVATAAVAAPGTRSTMSTCSSGLEQLPMEPRDRLGRRGPAGGQHAPRAPVHPGLSSASTVPAPYTATTILHITSTSYLSHAREHRCTTAPHTTYHWKHIAPF